MKIALISVHYSPLRSSCAIQMRDLAQELLLQGHEPIVIVPSESISKAWTNEIVDGIMIYRLSTFKTSKVSLFRRALSEALLPFIMIYNLRKSDFLKKELDAIVWYSPTIFFGPLISYLKRSSKCPTYLILRDMFPEWALDIGILKKNPIYYFFKLVANYQYKLADIIGVQSSSNLEYLADWKKKSNRRLEVLNNWLSIQDKRTPSISIADTNLNGKRIFIYIGNMGVAQGMYALIELAETMQYRKDIGFLFIGRGTEVEHLQESVINKKLENVLFYDEIDPKEIPALLDICHVGLVALDSRHKSHNIPGKFLTYMQAGLPVLAKINKGSDLALLIKKEKVGNVYTGSNINEFQQLAEMLIDNKSELEIMAERGHSLSYGIFSSNKAAKQIINSLSIYL